MAFGFAGLAFCQKKRRLRRHWRLIVVFVLQAEIGAFFGFVRFYYVHRRFLPIRLIFETGFFPLLELFSLAHNSRISPDDEIADFGRLALEGFEHLFVYSVLAEIGDMSD